MVSNNRIQVLPDSKGLTIYFCYKDEPPFTLEQQKAIHEICDSFLLTNRMRARNKRRYQKKKGGVSNGSSDE